jgi:hypothetical protein
VVGREQGLEKDTYYRYRGGWCIGAAWIFGCVAGVSDAGMNVGNVVYKEMTCHHSDQEHRTIRKEKTNL